MSDNFDEVLQILATVEAKPPFWLSNACEFYIYGTGTFGQDVYLALTERGVPVQGFLDHIKRGEQFYHGVPVFNPNEPINAQTPTEKSVVLAIHNPFADLVEIHKKLKALGYQRIITPIEMFDYLGDILGDRYWLTSRMFYRSMATVLEKVYRLWSDNTSRDIFSRIIKHRLTGDYSVLPQPDWDHRYAPDDIPAWQSPIRIIDCGAFEPDIATFSKLKGFIIKNSDKFPNSTLLPCGVYSTTTQLQFNANLGVNSGISKSGDTTIQCVAIDDALPDFHPTLIKMDIEGAEYDALLGAQKTIVNYKPGLAISLYHTPAHLWQIPLLVDRLVSSSTPAGHTSGSISYDYFLRPHMANGYELVFYAVPADSKETLE
jgi:FkbM family methyltransferase